MTQFVCKKCGKQATALEHKFCANCGNAYDYTATKMNVAFEQPIYQRILALHEKFYDYNANNEYFENLFSKGAMHMIPRFSDLIADFVDNNYQQNPEMKQVIELCKPKLKMLYFNIIADGYFAWVVENELKGKKISKSSALYSESFSNECFYMKDLLYSDFFNVFTGSQDGKYVSSEMAGIFLTLSTFQGSSHFNAWEELKQLEQIYSFIQSNFIVAIVNGYTIAFVDAKFRK